jgi:hypothetical protein
MKAFMLEQIKRQLKSAKAISAEELNEMRRVRLEDYRLPPEAVEAELGRVPPGSRMFFAMVERLERLVDAELNLVIETTRRLEMTRFWDFEIDDFLLHYEFVKMMPSGLIMHVTDTRIIFDSRPVPYAFWVPEGTPED